MGNTVTSYPDPMTGPRFEGSWRENLLRQLEFPACYMNDPLADPPSSYKQALPLLLRSPEKMPLIDRMLLFLGNDIGIPVSQMSGNLQVSRMLAFMLHALRGTTAVTDNFVHGDSVKVTYAGVPRDVGLVDVGGKTLVHFTGSAGLAGIAESMALVTGFTPLMETPSKSKRAGILNVFESLTGIFFTDSVSAEGSVGVLPDRSSAIFTRFAEGVLMLIFNSPHHGPIYLLPGPRPKSAVAVEPFSMPSPDMFEIVGLRTDASGLQAMEAANKMFAETLLEKGAVELLGGGSVSVGSAVARTVTTGLSAGGSAFGADVTLSGSAAKVEDSVRKVEGVAEKVEEAVRRGEMKTGRL